MLLDHLVGNVSSSTGKGDGDQDARSQSRSFLRGAHHDARVHLYRTLTKGAVASTIMGTATVVAVQLFAHQEAHALHGQGMRRIGRIFFETRKKEARCGEA